MKDLKIRPLKKLEQARNGEINRKNKQKEEE
jgi:hypothetical protein